MIAILLAALQAAAPVPGAVNPDVTQANVATTICAAGWTRTVRPPASYTARLKRRQMAAMGLRGSTAAFQEDHLISLEIGGHPTDPANLWPQRLHGHANALEKDRLEDRLHRLVCAGTITLAEAQDAIRTDWEAAYARYLGKTLR